MAADRRSDVAHVALLVLAFNLFYKALTDVLDWIGKAIDGRITAAHGLDAAQIQELQSSTSSCVTLIYTVVGIVVVLLVLRGPRFRRWLGLDGNTEAETSVFTCQPQRRRRVRQLVQYLVHRLRGLDDRTRLYGVRSVELTGC